MENPANSHIHVHAHRFASSTKQPAVTIFLLVPNKSFSTSLATELVNYTAAKEWMWVDQCSFMPHITHVVHTHMYRGTHLQKQGKLLAAGRNDLFARCLAGVPLRLNDICVSLHWQRSKFATWHFRDLKRRNNYSKQHTTPHTVGQIRPTEGKMLSSSQPGSQHDDVEWQDRTPNSLLKIAFAAVEAKSVNVWRVGRWKLTPSDAYESPSALLALSSFGLMSNDEWQAEEVLNMLLLFLLFLL